MVCQNEGYRNTWKLSCRPLAFTSQKRFGTSLPASFSAWGFEEKYFCYIVLTDEHSLSGCLYFMRYWAIYVF